MWRGEEGNEAEEVPALAEEENGPDEVDRDNAEQMGPSERIPLQGPPFRMDDPARMQLTNQERQWALSIKAAIEADNQIDPISDFMCVHLAIFFQGGIEAAVERALRLQTFRQEYDILDTLTDSRRALPKHIKLFPKHYLAYNFNKEDGNYYLVADVTQFSMDKMTRTEMFTAFNAGEYYLFHAMSADFELIRKGAILLAECEGYSWTQHMDVRMIQKVWLELAWTYPLQYQKAKHYNTGVMFNVFLSLVKKILPAQIGSKLETGFRCEHRLDTIYLVPTVEAANQRWLHNLDLVLQRRYELEKSFSLSDKATVNS
ncbi:expressed unknown protein [Seminavis robusta]|uniref:CRAL-TRIO domain-containing protein n=1 Tax=Seminavis robusta TaxID=568900 RepID=A0A9N8H6R4_9STRA|nr:expressed unknown protein [Seminavis robusta]|eukprot:Sro107_g054010.1 n/a (316) ;mRNA; f:98574-99521